MKRKVRIRIPSIDRTVSGVFQFPAVEFRYILLLAHGAGAGMEHPFIAGLADRFEHQNIATLRFQFPYMEEGKKRPDRPAVAHAAIEAAFGRALEYGDRYGLPVFAGGKSFGGRMISQWAALGGLSEAKGLIFFGFPLHAAGKPDTKRAEHLADVPHGMLFHQGTRDALAELRLISQAVEKLHHARINILEGADHSFRTLKSSGVSPDQILDRIVEVSVGFMSASIR